MAVSSASERADGPEAVVADAVRVLRAEEERDLADLAELVAIPGVSADPGAHDHLHAVAAYVAAWLRARGYEQVQTRHAGAHPVVTARGEWAGPDAPTVLFYGHLDVQPPGDPADWTTPPFEMTRRGDRLYGRGTGDDKGQIWIHLTALEALRRVTGTLPVNVAFLLETEEEIGSPHLEEFLREHPETIRADVAVVSDSPMVAEGRPTLGTGLRGLCGVEVELRTLNQDLHSGQYGGAVPNAAVALAGLIGSLHDADGRVAVPGFYDGLLPVHPAETEAARALDADADEWIRTAGAIRSAGETGLGPRERTWFRPTLEVNGASAGYTGDGIKTIVPSAASCKITARLVPGMDPAVTRGRIEEHVRRVLRGEAEVRVHAFAGSAQPFHADVDGRVFELARQSLAAAFGRDVVPARDGGSIPVVPLLAANSGTTVLLMNFGCPDENKHAPNEWLSLKNFRGGQETLVRLLLALGTEGRER